MRLRDADYEANGRLYEALKHAMGAVSETVPLQWLQALALLSVDDGLTLTELAQKVGASPSTMSRQLLDMGASKRDGAPGHGLVYSVPHPSVPCAKSYRLTLKGQTLVRVMAARLTTGPLASP